MSSRTAAPPSETVTDHGTRLVADTAEPFLFVALHADDPRRPTSRHALGEVDEVRLLRGPARSVTRVREGQKRVLVLEVPDPRMSANHAVLSRRGSSWSVKDLGSKNGTRVDGERTEKAALESSALIEVGHTFVLFRSEAIGDGDGPDVDSSGRGHAAPELSTLCLSMGRAFARLVDVASSTLPIVVGGETGTGKEVVARAVHAISGRRGAFVAVNCGALPSTLVETELFGFRKGSFSGAHEDRGGLVRAASGGTLFLDEVAELALPAQATLLRVLQEREVLPVGSTTPIPIDLRVVAATHVDLAAAVRRGAFRDDLLARLSGFRLQLPPLRDRLEDLGLLCAKILGKTDAGTVRFTAEAARSLFSHPFGGNVRELEHRLNLGVVLAKGCPIEAAHLFGVETLDGRTQLESPSPAVGGEEPPASRQPQSMNPEDSARRDELMLLLREHRGNVTAVARSMGKARVQIQRWLRRYGLDRQAWGR
jgi:DNA-binding NtrC family response regulator